MAKKIDMPALGQPCALVISEGALFFHEKDTELIHKALGVNVLSYAVTGRTRCVFTEEAMEWSKNRTVSFSAYASIHTDLLHLGAFLAPIIKRSRGTRESTIIEVDKDSSLRILGDPSVQPCELCPTQTRFACHTLGGSGTMFKRHEQSSDECRILVASRALPTVDIGKLEAAGFWVTTSLAACQHYAGVGEASAMLVAQGESFNTEAEIDKMTGDSEREYRYYSFVREILDPVSSLSSYFGFDNIDMTAESIRGRRLGTHVRRQLKQIKDTEQAEFEARECSRCVMGGPKACGGRTAFQKGQTCAVTRNDLEALWRNAVHVHGSEHDVKRRMATWSLTRWHAEPKSLGFLGTVPLIFSGIRHEQAVFRRACAPFAEKTVEINEAIENIAVGRHVKNDTQEVRSWELHRLDQLSANDLMEQYWSMSMAVNLTFPRYEGSNGIRMRYHKNERWHRNEVLYVNCSVNEITIGCDTRTNNDGGMGGKGSPIDPYRRPRFVVHIQSSTIGTARRQMLEKIGVNHGTWSINVGL